MTDPADLQKRVEVLERELVNANAANAELQRQVRVLESKAKAYDELEAEAKGLRAELDELRRKTDAAGSASSAGASPVVQNPSPLQPGSASRIAQLRSELEALTASPAAGHSTGWQSKDAPAATPADEVDRLMSMQNDAARVEAKEDAELEARLARLRGK
uniref:Uncharacterized protein n=1 Tax=Neobodo designis TaxID=312471 RepID=A0A7S1LDL2_NEODS|mmetsp:Transcript_20066/g.62326  ORF Transcript_20066/g.62326 Transcript_20066/m.62326 type:complete len:160 (+) Transcript_20066:68-547(+)